MAEVAAAGADPAKVSNTDPICTPPAESAAKVKSAKSSTELFDLACVDPSGVAETVSLDRKTVTAFAFGEDRVTADEAFDVEPRAITTSAAVSIAVFWPRVLILNTWVVLSDAPDEEYEETSPLSVSETEPARGTTTGVAKLNL